MLMRSFNSHKMFALWFRRVPNRHLSPSMPSLSLTFSLSHFYFRLVCVCVGKCICVCHCHLALLVCAAGNGQRASVWLTVGLPFLAKVAMKLAKKDTRCNAHAAHRIARTQAHCSRLAMSCKQR